MSIIFVFGPCWNNLHTLLKTIEININMVPNYKFIYIVTNDINVLKHFEENKSEKIKCHKFSDNEGHQTSCFNAIISGMKMVIENDKDNDDDIVIFSHEDVFINDLSLFNNSLSKFKKGIDIVCRIYKGTEIGEKLDYYMNDAFFIRKQKINEIFGNTNTMTIHIGMFCEEEFTKIIEKFKILSIPYSKHTSHKDSELGFYHILTYENGVPCWDKSNIQEIYDL